MATKKRTSSKSAAAAVAPAPQIVLSPAGRTRLFATGDRNASHKKLAAILKAGQHPHAECREDLNSPDGLCFTVWDGPELPPERPPEAPAPPIPQLDQQQMEAVTEMIVEKLAARLALPLQGTAAPRRKAKAK